MRPHDPDVDAPDEGPLFQSARDGPHRRSADAERPVVSRQSPDERGHGVRRANAADRTLGRSGLFDQAYLVDLLRREHGAPIKQHLKEYLRWFPDARGNEFRTQFGSDVLEHCLPQWARQTVRTGQARAGVSCRRGTTGTATRSGDEAQTRRVSSRSGRDCSRAVALSRSAVAVSSLLPGMEREGGCELRLSRWRFRFSIAISSNFSWACRDHPRYGTAYQRRCFVSRCRARVPDTILRRRTKAISPKTSTDRRGRGSRRW